jgi:hypothetical protein
MDSLSWPGVYGNGPKPRIAVIAAAAKTDAAISINVFSVPCVSAAGPTGGETQETAARNRLLRERLLYEFAASGLV